MCKESRRPAFVASGRHPRTTRMGAMWGKTESMVDVQILGSGDAFGSGGRLQACFALRGGPEDLLVECGASSLVAMKRAGIEPNDIAWVVVSHLHGDHFGGLPFLVLDGQFRRRERPLVIAGPPGLGERLHAAMEVLFPGSASASRRFETRVVELDPEQR